MSSEQISDSCRTVGINPGERGNLRVNAVESREAAQSRPRRSVGCAKPAVEDTDCLGDVSSPRRHIEVSLGSDGKAATNVGSELFVFGRNLSGESALFESMEKHIVGTAK